MTITEVEDLANAGDIEGAWKITEGMIDDGRRAEAASFIARVTGDPEDFENAKILASYI